MDAKRFILATLAGAITLFLLGWLFYGFLLMDFYEKAAGSSAAVYREVPIFWAIFLGEVAMAALLTKIFGWSAIKGFMGGLKGGATIGVLLALGINLIFYGTTTLGTLTSWLFDVIVALIRYGIAGGVIGWVVGRK